MVYSAMVRRNASTPYVLPEQTHALKMKPVMKKMTFVSLWLPLSVSKTQTVTTESSVTALKPVKTDYVRMGRIPVRKTRFVWKAWMPAGVSKS